MRRAHVTRKMFAPELAFPSLAGNRAQPAHCLRRQAAQARNAHQPRSSRRWLNGSLLLACVMLPLALFLFKVIEDRHAAIAQAERDTGQLAGLFEQHAVTTLKSYQLVANLLDEHAHGASWGTFWNWPENSATLLTFLSDFVSRYPWIGGVSLVDTGGKIQLTTLSGLKPGDLLDGWGLTPDVPSHRSDRLLVGQSQEHGGAHHLDIARPLTLPDGKPGGLIVMSTRPSFFTDFWQRGAPDDATLLFRTDGRLLAHYPAGWQDVAEATVGKPLLAAAKNTDHGSLVSPFDRDGRNRLIAYRKLPGFPVYIAHAIPMSRVLRQWRVNAMRDGAFFLLAGGALSLLALAVTRHSRGEADAINLLLLRTNELTEEAHRRSRAEADLGAVLRDTMERQEAERKHLARELHDSLGQHVAVLHMGLDAVLRTAADPARVREQVWRLKTTATAVSVEIGRLAWELRPTGLDDLGLEAALRSLVETTSRRSGLQIDLHIRPPEIRPSDAVEATLYRVIQEAVTNIIKHAGASRAGIVVEFYPRRARVIVEDNGKGFVWDETLAGKPGERLGLLGMRERLSLVGGSLEIESSLGQGATLFIEVPAGDVPAKLVGTGA